LPLFIGFFTKLPISWSSPIDEAALNGHILVMDEQERVRCEARAAIFKALGHPTRLFILQRLREAPHCVCELTDLVGADTSTISKHLSILRNVGLVRSEKRRTAVYYYLACACLEQFLDGAENLLQMKSEADSAALR
jgi:ArsR family transcriptional regulator